jgi:hypothetical protein
MMNPIIALKIAEFELDEAALHAVFPVAAVKPVLQVVQVVVSAHLSQLAMQETLQSAAAVFPVAAVVFPDSQLVQTAAPAVAVAAGAAIQVPIGQAVQAVAPAVAVAAGAAA